MTLSALNPPRIDPTSIFEHFRGGYGSQLLTAAVAHLGVFPLLAEGPLPLAEYRRRLGLADRPFVVLTCALRAMGLLENLGGRFSLTDAAREHLLPGGEFDVSDYIRLAAQSPEVLEMTVRLRSNRPAGEEDGGAAFIYREGLESAMEQESAARVLTMSLAGRAKNVAPLLASEYPLDDARLLLDVGGGSGIYSIAWLQQHPRLQAVVLDRPEVLKVASEMAGRYGVADRLQLQSGDMFEGPLPSGADVILLSNILHDWDLPQCRALVERCAAALAPGGRLLIHDVFLSDDHDGPLPIALYSAALFTLTEGRAYSAAEFRRLLTDAGLTPGEIVPTLIHCGVLPGVK